MDFLYVFYCCSHFFTELKKIFFEPDPQLARRSTPQKLDRPAQKPYHRNQRSPCFRATASFPKNPTLDFRQLPTLTGVQYPRKHSTLLNFFVTVFGEFALRVDDEFLANRYHRKVRVYLGIFMRDP